MQWPIRHVAEPQGINQLKRVVNLCGTATEIVHAGDPDPEGQRLVDEVIEHAGCEHKPCQRILINDNNPAAIRKALTQLESNDQYRGLSLSALARAVCDQRYGFNLTRLYTLSARALGHDGMLSVGRVQTPILALVVQRDQAHEQHRKTPYYTLTADFHLSHPEPGPVITATCQPAAPDTVDDKNRLLNKAEAEAIQVALDGAQGQLVSVDTQPRSRSAPLPHHLLSLQAEASRRYGYRPKQVLAITQQLRDEYRAITYNRSDCRYLNDERHADAPALLQVLSGAFASQAAAADPALKSKAFNANKVTAHHAIIPTLSVPDLATLPEPARQVYELIVIAYLAQFYPDEQWRTTTLLFDVPRSEGPARRFKANGRVDVAPGWTVLFKAAPEELKDDGNDEPEPRIEGLEGLQADTPAEVTAARCQEQFTQPPPRYTMASLLLDLPRVARYVTDPHIKKLLLDKDADKQAESGGIGTPATRDSMIDKLFQRGFIREDGKQLVSTDLGRQFITALPDFVTRPDLTALWSEQQRQIEAGELDYHELINAVDRAIAGEVQRVRQAGIPLPAATGPACPACNSPLLRRKSAKGHFWACAEREACGYTCPDRAGQPDTTPREKPVLSDHLCPACQQPLIRRPSKKEPGQYWWSCSGYPACKNTARDDNGQPVP